MKDRIFTGPDVDEALASAAASLGLPMAQLRYVLLDAGSSGGRGLKPTPARIAVLLQQAPAPGPARAASAPSPRSGPQPEAVDIGASLQAVVRAVAEAGNLKITGEIEETDEALVLHLRGEDATFFHGEDGRGDALHALEHVLQRIHSTALYPLVLRVRCEGYRERRDQALANEARQLAEQVRADGSPREMEPLNAYERRIVHVALQDQPGIRTFSVGEGYERRVTVATSADASAAPGGGRDGDER